MPPTWLPDHVSRFEAARLLGYASAFPVRQLEKSGRLKAARGIMGSAWYPRADVLALRTEEAVSPGRAVAVVATHGEPRGTGARRPSDAELIAYLRRPAARPSANGAPRVPSEPTVADLVADMGVSIARAQKVYRFWLAHDVHPAANAVRTGRRNDRHPVVTSAAPGSRSPGEAGEVSPKPGPPERRSPERLTRATLIRQLRSPDPAIRAAAFEALKGRPPSADGQ